MSYLHGLEIYMIMIYQRLLITEWKCLQQFHSGDIVNRIQKDTTEISQFITDILPNFFAILIKFIGAFVFLFLIYCEVTIFY